MREDTYHNHEIIKNKQCSHPEEVENVVVEKNGINEALDIAALMVPCENGPSTFCKCEEEEDAFEDSC